MDTLRTRLKEAINEMRKHENELRSDKQIVHANTYGHCAAIAEAALAASTPTCAKCESTFAVEDHNGEPLCANCFCATEPLDETALAAPAPSAGVEVEWPMIEAEVRQLIDACNHAPTRQVLCDYLQLRALQHPAAPSTSSAGKGRLAGFTQFHLDNWTDDDFKQHIPAVREALQNAIRRPAQPKFFDDLAVHGQQSGCRYLKPLPEQPSSNVPGEAMRDWMPIENAPKDSHVILFCDARGNRWTQTADCRVPVCGYPPIAWQELPNPPI